MWGREREGEEREMEAEGKALYMSPTFYGQKRFFCEKIFGDSGNSNECLCLFREQEKKEWLAED